MASSGVWENVNLTITPTFDGACGMLFFIIILAGIVFAKCWHVCHYVVIFEFLNFFDVGCDRCCCHNWFVTTGCCWQMLFAMWLWYG